MIIAGFGFRDMAGVDSLADALARTQDGSGAPAPEAVATIPEKAKHPALRALADQLGLPILIAHPDPDLQTPTDSPAVRVAFGAGSVAEASAWSAAGNGGRLLAPRSISGDRMATCALAEGDGP
ncbi:MAG: cobalamin biosynthesis protein [Marinibacterium sp.]